MSALLQATAVGKEFSQPGENVVALQDIDLTVERGELVVVTGESGSGKSTLLSLLGAIDRPTRGKIHLLGESLTEASTARLTELRSRHIGFVFQDFLLVRHLPALENVRLPQLFGHVPDGPDPRALLNRVGLGTRAGHRPDALSRGEMQRVALARALVNRPDLLLADEPTANLDRRNSDAVWELLHELNRDEGLTIVVATHNVAAVRDAARVVRLDDGRIIPDQER